MVALILWGTNLSSSTISENRVFEYTDSVTDVFLVLASPFVCLLLSEKDIWTFTFMLENVTCWILG